MNTLTINFTNEKITVCPSERMSNSLFKAFRNEGWLWSRREMAFIFNKNIEGVKRVKRLFNYSFLDKYGVPDADKTEGKEFIFEFLNDKSQKEYNALFEQYQKEKETESIRKQAKKEQENKNRLDKIKKVIEQAKGLCNGFKVDTYHLANNNFNLLDTGVEKQVKVKEFCEENGIATEGLSLENKVLCLKIAERDKGNWRTGKNIVLSLDISEFNKTGNAWITGGSGCYNCELTVEQVERRNIKDYIRLSAAVDSEMERRIVENYIGYLRGEKTVKTSFIHDYIVDEQETEELLRNKYFA